MKIKKIKTFYFYIVINIFCNVFAKTDLPKWINEPNLECKNDNICSVGIGSNIDIAKTDAKNNIQKYFETKLNSYFRNEISNDKNNNFTENSSEIISEESNGILKGVEIVKTYNKNGTFYALASLNKVKVINEIKTDISSLDEEMSILIKDKSFISSKKLEDAFSKRKNLNKKYLFLTNKNIPEIIKYEDIVKHKKESKKNSLNYYIDIDNAELKTLITSLVSENGGTITTINNSNISIKAKLNTKKEFLNVNGFEKYSISVEIFYIKNGKIVNTLYKKETNTGISFEQIYAKSMNNISSYIKENFIKLIE